jgi:hypothetical protein
MYSMQLVVFAGMRMVCPLLLIVPSQSSFISNNTFVYYIHTCYPLWVLRDKWKRKEGTNQVLIGQEIFNWVVSRILTRLLWCCCVLHWQAFILLLFSSADRAMTPTYLSEGERICLKSVFNGLTQHTRTFWQAFVKENLSVWHFAFWQAFILLLFTFWTFWTFEHF